MHFPDITLSISSQKCFLEIFRQVPYHDSLSGAVTQAQTSRNIEKWQPSQVHHKLSLLASA